MQVARWYFTSFLLCAALIGSFERPALAGAAPEPEAYWTGPMQGDVPASLHGGHVIGAQELVGLIDTRAPVLIDVAERPHRPASMPPDRLWKPAEHRDIAGSVWLPGVGAGAVDPALENHYRDRLAALTHGDRDRPIVVYCHAHCWASWNAAKRAISFGYRNVYWYPGGVEEWQDAGRDLAAAKDDGLVRDRQEANQ